MLQQILRDMYVDPEILAGLDEQQKQTLFCKMREEQIRRWTLWNEKLDQNQLKIIKNNNNNNTKKKKKVEFLKGTDGEPWVWVMGEHKNDKSIEEILKEETIEKARKIAEKEAEQLRKQVEAQLIIEEITNHHKNDDDDNSNNKNNNNNNNNNNMDIYCSVEELREKINKPKCLNYSLNHYNQNNKFNFFDKCDVLQEISLNTQKVAQRVALWEKKLTEERTCEIFQTIRKKQQQAAKEAEEAEKKQEQLWIEQERKAKQAEQQIREIARRAREEHRLTSSNFDIDSPYCTTYLNNGVPPGRQAVLYWYKTNEIPRGAGLIPLPPIRRTIKMEYLQPWFHGLITRSNAEDLLSDQSDGTFLLRLSEKIWGYAISLKAKDKCKHYLVSAPTITDKYQFLGQNQRQHQTLNDLVDYFKEYCLTDGVKLLNPCPRNTNLNAINELF